MCPRKLWTRRILKLNNINERNVLLWHKNNDAFKHSHKMLIFYISIWNFTRYNFDQVSFYLTLRAGFTNISAFAAQSSNLTTWCTKCGYKVELNFSHSSFKMTGIVPAKQMKMVTF